jgi:hypothetical protein
MPINELIARGVDPIQFESPVNQLAKVLQIQGAQQNIARGEMEQDQYRQGVERKNKLVQLMGGLPGDATDDQRSAALKGGGYFDEADKLDKGVLERRKIGSEASAKDFETARKKLDIAGSAFNQVRQSPTLQNANAVLDYLGANGVYTPDLVAQYKAQVAANPADIGRLADIAFRSSLDAKEQLVKHVSQNMGGSMVDKVFDSTTGQLTTIGSAPITQSADNAASNARQAAEGAANRAVQMRGQTLADFRARDLNENSREANRIAQDNKPLTEGQSKSALFGARMQEANDILDTLAKGGTEKSTPGMNAGYGVGTLVSGLSSNDQQQLMQAKRNFLNAVLRRESGAVIGDSEFANANLQYFPQIGDTPQVIAQKKANREAATRGVLIDVPESRRERIVSDIRGPKAAQAATPPEKTPSGASVSGW